MTTPGVYAEVVGGSGSTVATTGPTAVATSSKVYFSLRNLTGGPLSFADLVINGSSFGTVPARRGDRNRYPLRSQHPQQRPMSVLRHLLAGRLRRQ